MNTATATTLTTLGFVLAASLAACWLAWLVARAQRHRADRRAELQARLIDKVDSPEAFATFVESESGRRFFDSSELPGVAGEIVAATRRGVVLVAVALGCLLIRGFFPRFEVATVAGLLLLAAGVGLVIAARVSERQARRLGAESGLPGGAVPPSTVATGGRPPEGTGDARPPAATGEEPAIEAGGDPAAE